MGTIQQSGQNGRSPNALSYEQLGSCADVIEDNMEFVHKKAWNPHKHVFYVKEIRVQACENFVRPPNRTTREKIVAPRSDCNHEDREFIVDSGESLHMRSHSELTSGEKKVPSGDEKEPTNIMTAQGLGGSTEETTVHVNDLDVFITTMLLEDSPAALSLDLSWEEVGYSRE